MQTLKKRKNTKLDKKRQLETNLRIAIKEIGFPPCYDSKAQYQKWLEIETVVHTLRFKRNVCEDCPKAYQKAMIEQERCVNKDFLVKN